MKWVVRLSGPIAIIFSQFRRLTPQLEDTPVQISGTNDFHTFQFSQAQFSGSVFLHFSAHILVIFYVLLTVHLSIILATDQLNAQILVL